nr:hypothetical protein [Tanacetum cinerariifolium]
GHFKRDCPKLKNKDEEKVNAPGWVYAVRNAKKRGNLSRDLDSNVVTSQKENNSRMYQSSGITLKSFPRTCWVFLQCDQWNSRST